MLGDVGEETRTLATNLGSTWSKVDAAAKVRSRAELQRAVRSPAAVAINAAVQGMDVSVDMSAILANYVTASVTSELASSPPVMRRAVH